MISNKMKVRCMFFFKNNSFIKWTLLLIKENHATAVLKLLVVSPQLGDIEQPGIFYGLQNLIFPLIYLFASECQCLDILLTYVFGHLVPFLVVFAFVWMSSHDLVSHSSCWAYVSMVHTLCCANLNTFVPFWKYAESLSTFSKDGKHADAISNIRWKKQTVLIFLASVESLHWMSGLKALNIRLWVWITWF